MNLPSESPYIPHNRQALPEAIKQLVHKAVLTARLITPESSITDVRKICNAMKLTKLSINVQEIRVFQSRLNPILSELSSSLATLITSIIDIHPLEKRMVIIRVYVGELSDERLLVLALSHDHKGLDILNRLGYTIILDYVRLNTIQELQKAAYPKLTIRLILSILFCPLFRQKPKGPHLGINFKIDLREDYQGGLKVLQVLLGLEGLDEIITLESKYLLNILGFIIEMEVY